MRRGESRNRGGRLKAVFCKLLRAPFDRTWGNKQSNHRAVKLTASMVQSGLGLNLPRFFVPEYFMLSIVSFAYVYFVLRIILLFAFVSLFQPIPCANCRGSILNIPLLIGPFRYYPASTWTWTSHKINSPAVIPTLVVPHSTFHIPDIICQPETRSE